MVKNKCAVVTGTNRGIGHAIVEKLAYSGADVFACARTETEDFKNWAACLQEKTGRSVIPIYFELQDTGQMKEAFLKIKRSQLPVDILVNAAAGVHNANFLMTSSGKLQELFEINYFSQIQFTQYILKIMLRQKNGSIINIASSGGIDGNPGRTAYNATKAAVISTTKTMARELGKNGIRVNAVAPGLIDTDMARDNTPEDVMQRELDSTCMGRIGRPEEIANVVEFLASDASSYVTGQVWRVDGGM